MMVSIRTAGSGRASKQATKRSVSFDGMGHPQRVISISIYIYVPFVHQRSTTTAEVGMGIVIRTSAACGWSETRPWYHRVRHKQGKRHVGCGVERRRSRGRIRFRRRLVAKVRLFQQVHELETSLFVDNDKHISHTGGSHNETQRRGGPVDKGRAAMTGPLLQRWSNFPHVTRAHHDIPIATFLVL